MAEHPAPTITPVATAARLLLHCDPADRAAIAERAGLDLPEPMLRTAATAGWHALHLAPDEWLLIGPVAAGAALAGRIASSASNIAHSLVDVSDRQLALELSGASAPDALAAGCPLDLDAARFPTGACTRTLFGKAAILLWRTDDAPTFRVEFGRSYADYVGRLLAAAVADL